MPRSLRLAGLIALGLAILIVSACQGRMPLSRIEASAAARNWLLRDGLAWGDVLDTSGPGAPDADGRSWWTVRFKPIEGENRVLLVNAVSGWVKRAD